MRHLQSHLFLCAAVAAGIGCDDEEGSYPDRPLQVSNGGGGLVVSDDVPIECGRECQHQFRGSWEPFTLHAVPEADGVFLGWQGDCSGAGPCSIGPVQSAFVVAEFGPVVPVAAHLLSSAQPSWAYKTTVSDGALVSVVEAQANGENAWQLVASGADGADRWRIPLSTIAGGWPSLPVLESSGSRTVLAGGFFDSFAVGAVTIGLPAARGCFFAVIDDGVVMENTLLECGSGIVEDAIWIGETLWLTGSFSGAMTFGSVNLVSSGGLDGFVAARGAGGDWTAVSVGGPGDDVVMAIAPSTVADRVTVLTRAPQAGLVPGLPLPAGLVLFDVSGDMSDWNLSADLGSVAAERAELLALDSGHVVAASFTGVEGSPTAGYSDLLVARVDTSGAVLWRRNIASTGADRLGGLALLGDQLLVAGAFMGSLDIDGHQLAASPYSPFANLALNETNDGLFVALSTSTGMSSWARQVGGPGQEQVLDVATMDDRVFVVGGMSFGSTVQHVFPDPSTGSGAAVVEWARRP